MRYRHKICLLALACHRYRHDATPLLLPLLFFALMLARADACR